MGNGRYEVRKLRPTQIELISQLWDEPVPMVATDLSPAGLFIASDLLIEPGGEVVACFDLPGHGQEFQLFGAVAWVALPRRATDTGKPGMGVRFVQVRPVERLCIRQAVLGFPEPQPFSQYATHMQAAT